MKIKVNNEERIFEGEISIAKLLVACKVEMPDMVSVQLNGEFVDKDTYEKVFIKKDDEVDFLYFMGGGENNKELI